MGSVWWVRVMWFICWDVRVCRYLLNDMILSRFMF